MNNANHSKPLGKLSVRDLCHIALFVAVISVCAQIQIPMPLGMPLTLQTFAIMLAGIVLGAKKGMIASFAYVLLGAFGVPVFSAFTGGLGIIFGRTGGFILSFPLLALAAGIGAKKDNWLWMALWLLIGATINFTSGVLMFSAVMEMSLSASFGFAAAPFIPTELVKIALLVVFGSKIKKRIGRICN
jgi:biotin transport system substrate-specific component